MNRILAVSLLLVLAVPRLTIPQSPPEAGPVTFDVEELDLGFENEPVERWNPDVRHGQVTLDESEKHSGERGLKLTCDPQPRAVAAFSVEFPVEVARGRNLRYTGYLKSEGVSGHGAALLLRVEGPHGLIAYDNMRLRRVNGTTDWNRHELSFDVPEDAVRIVFGAVLGGPGTLWVDTLGFELGEVAPPPVEAAEEPAPEEVVAWIRDTAVPLTSTEAGNGFDDLRALRGLVGDARVVGLGEATHGTREFFQLKHRLFEFLVEEMGFTVLAIEANWPESAYVRDYVLAGRGDAATALGRLAFPLWVTQEVHELVEWIRRYNADPTHRRKVLFYGVDIQVDPFALAPRVVEYLERVDDPETAIRFQMSMMEWQAGAAVSEEGRRKGVAALGELVERFDAEESRYVARSSEFAWTLVRQVVVVLEQALRLFNSSLTGSGDDRQLRDEAMAANVEWILRTHGPDTRVAVWAHNGHVSKAPESFGKPMGQHLAESLGAAYVAVGLFFNRGFFQAFNTTRGFDDPGFFGRFELPPAPAGYLGAAFARAGLPIFALDLRQRPAAGPVADWLARPHPGRQVGTAYSGRGATLPQSLVELYDGVVFVDETNRARPLSSTP